MSFPPETIDNNLSKDFYSKPPEFNNFIASALATSIAELVTAPICLVRTNVINTGLPIKNVINHIYKDGKVLAFYRASLPAISGQVLSSSSKYVLYQYLNKTFNNESNQYIRIINGTITGITVSIITHPIDFIKINMQMADKIYHKIKVRPSIIYDGYSKTLGKATLSGACFFPLYEYIKDRTDSPITSGLISASISTILMQPLDYMKTRQIFGLNFSYSNIRLLFTGLELNLCRVIPHFTIMMFLTEKFKSKF
jgi:uncharacterized membrane protein